MIPSAKLLSLVLACNVTEVGEIHGNTLGFSVNNVDVGRINIHELANLCKEFAWNGVDVKVGAKTFFWLASNKEESGEWHCWTHGSYSKVHFYGSTEPEAVFKTMEFIIGL